MRQFDQTLAFIERIQQARTPEAICRLLMDAAGRCGLTTFIAGTLPDPGSSPETQKAHILLCEWPAKWFERYFARNYIEHDPLVSYLRRMPSPTTWQGAARSVPVNEAGRRVCADASEFDLNDGIAFPIVTLDGTVVMVSMGGPAAELSPTEFAAISLMATYAVGRALQLSVAGDSMDDRPDLTSREVECIRWAAIGKSEWEISQILGISEHTSEKHLLNAKAKLGAVNRVHAVAEAIRYGYVT